MLVAEEQRALRKIDDAKTKADRILQFREEAQYLHDSLEKTRKINTAGF